MKIKVIYILALTFYIGCDKKTYTDYTPTGPSTCNITDVTGACCSEDDLDCNNICFGNSAINCNNICESIAYISSCNGCNDSEAMNYNENSTDDYNCIYDNLPENFNLIWNDEFNSPQIDLSKWNFEIGGGGWGNEESQFYTDNSDNAFTENGKLVIKAINENYSGSNYTSARMTTKNKGDFTYGKIEIKAKLPIGDGTWPAIWMMPTNSVYGGWPNSGEIDIMEHVGCTAGTIYGTIHCNQFNHTNGTSDSGNDNINISEFHIYSIEWNSNSIKWYVDNQEFHTYNKTGDDFTTWPFDQDFFLILNMAVGGNWGGICEFNSNIYPQKFEIDYVRIYE